MLVLSRKVGEKLMIGDGITVVVNRVAGNRVTLGIEAPNDVRILRGELAETAAEFEETQDSQPAPSRPLAFHVDSTAPFTPRAAR